MEELEDIFNKAAHLNMKDWDIRLFKHTHPTLFKTIMHAMNLVKGDIIKSEIDRSNERMVRRMISETPQISREVIQKMMHKTIR